MAGTPFCSSGTARRSPSRTSAGVEHGVEGQPPFEARSPEVSDYSVVPTQPSALPFDSILESGAAGEWRYEYTQGRPHFHKKQHSDSFDEERLFCWSTGS